MKESSSLLFSLKPFPSMVIKLLRATTKETYCIFCTHNNAVCKGIPILHTYTLFCNLKPIKNLCLPFPFLSMYTSAAL